MMNGQFSGKHVLITGGGRGIGFEIARQFGQQGAQLSIFDNAEDLLADATAKFNKNQFEVHPFLVDVSQRSDVFEAVDAVEGIAPIDILINNAGIAFETPFLQIDEAEWKKIDEILIPGVLDDKIIRTSNCFVEAHVYRFPANFGVSQKSFDY
jgi:NAD(P)-dependent dehydrogenase (short-subunit alcohol dehydrogenase family)